MPSFLSYPWYLSFYSNSFPHHTPRQTCPVVSSVFVSPTYLLLDFFEMLKTFFFYQINVVDSDKP